MAETSELIEFRRAFVWLLCGMLLPSVALVAFGVVAVANERAAVERRLAEDYDARVRALGLDLLARLEDRKSTRLNSSHLVISYAVFCLKKKKKLPRTGRGSCTQRGPRASRRL